MSKTASIAVLGIAALLLAGCSSAPKDAPVGTSLEVEVRSPDTQAHVNLTVTGIESLRVSELKDQLELPDEYSDGTVFLAHYDVKLTDGNFPSNETYAFSHYNWQATGSGDAEVATVSSLGSIDIDGCELFSDEMAATLSSGESASACVIFAAADAEASIESVTYGQESVSRRGSGDGWTWTANS